MAPSSGSHASTRPHFVSHPGASWKISVRHRPGLGTLTTTSAALGRAESLRARKMETSLVNWYRLVVLREVGSLRSARREEHVASGRT